MKRALTKIFELARQATTPWGLLCGLFMAAIAMEGGERAVFIGVGSVFVWKISFVCHIMPTKGPTLAFGARTSELLTNMVDASKMFDEAQQEVWQLMANDSLKHFRSTQAYEQALYKKGLHENHKKGDN